MARDKIIDYDEALEEAKASGPRPSVLLGNGFSRGFSNDFAYRRLRDVAEMPDLSVAKDDLFGHARSDDFETVMENLRQSARLVEIYDPKNQPLATAMRADAEVVKRGLVDALTEIHPSSAWAVDDDKYRPARKFLAEFRRIFTVNYDLLLYWTILQSHLRPSVVMLDGFRRPGGGELTWTRPDTFAGQEIFYLHGAVHLFVRDRRVRKLEVSNGRILSQLRSNLKQGRYPLVVTEGSREDKEARIGRSAYLTYCHERLRVLGGPLLIHGMALSPNDDHILGAITDKSSKVDTLFVGLHGKGSADRDAVQTRARALARERKSNGGKPLKVSFYQSETAKVWG